MSCFKAVPFRVDEGVFRGKRGAMITALYVRDED
jgi:hypothetical protein